MTFYKLLLCWGVLGKSSLLGVKLGASDMQGVSASHLGVCPCGSRSLEYWSPLSSSDVSIITCYIHSHNIYWEPLCKWLRQWRIHLQLGRPQFNPWVRKIPWRRAWQPTPVFLPGELPWTEETDGLQFMALQRDGHNWLTKLSRALLVVQTRYRKVRGTRDQIAIEIHIKLIIEKAKEFQKASGSATLTTLKPVCGSQQTVENS